MEKPYYAPSKDSETVFTVGSSSLKFGAGALGELGEDAVSSGMTRVALFTDRIVGATECAAIARDSLGKAGMDVVVYDECRVEPTDTSMTAAAQFARDGGLTASSRLVADRLWIRPRLPTCWPPIQAIS